MHVFLPLPAMLEAFKKYVLEHRLFAPPDKILLAVSGGVDSMVMLDLFYRGGFTFSVAHCNYRLRGEESDKDEAFVIEKCRQYAVEYFVKPFDTKAYAEANKLSVQMAARELRFEWFNQLLQQHSFSAYATAHHGDDELETFFINLLRGSGIAGLHGILPRQNKLVHPMLFAWRDEIEDYAKDRNIVYRTDSSNSSTKYVRNQIRHQLLPLIGKINPNYREIISTNMDHVREAEKIYRKEIRRKHNEWVHMADNGFKIAIEPLVVEENAKTYLYEFLVPCGFNWSTVTDIIHALQASPGKCFYSATHRVVKDRDYLLVEVLEQGKKGIYFLDENKERLESPISLSMSVGTKDINFQIPHDRHVAVLDYDKLHFPLKIRRWRTGDDFRPLGMSGFKKLSDFFIDEKLSVADKERTWLLLSGDDIVWVIGQRLDDRYKVTAETQRICQVEIVK